MKSLKVLSLLFTLFFISVNATYAQSKEDLTDEQKEEFKKNLKEYAMVLNLSDEQKSKFGEITKKYAGQMKDLKEDSGSRLSKYKKMKSIQKSKNAEMKDLLSKDQYKIYLKKQEEMQERLKDKRKDSNK